MTTVTNHLFGLPLRGLLCLPFLLAACSSAPASTPIEGAAGVPAAHAAASEVPAASGSAVDDALGIRICLQSACNASCAKTPGVAGGSCSGSVCVCDAPTCGGMLQAPCANDYCSSGHYDAALNLCGHCGDVGEACCNTPSAPGIPDCYGNTYCPVPGENGQACAACGGAGQPACPPANCGLIDQPPCPGQKCVEGHYDPLWQVCDNCGEIGQACCGGPTPASGTTQCYDGVCRGNTTLDTVAVGCAAACGANGQAPCNVASGASCQSGTVLSGSQCVTCGTEGAIPCAGNTCNAPYGIANGKCEPCGQKGEGLCDDGCASGLGILQGLCNDCGHLNGPKCDIGACDDGLVEAWGSLGTGLVCVASCGNLGEHACVATLCVKAGPNGQPTDYVPVDNICELNPDCGHNGQGCCDAGSFFGDGADLCHDGSSCIYNSPIPGAGSWMCTFSTGFSGGSCSVVEHSFHEMCDADACQELPDVGACQGDNPVTPTGDPGCLVYPGVCPR